MRAARRRARTEQWVTDHLPHKDPRSDVVATLAPGESHVYYDVVVAHPFTVGVCLWRR